MSRRRASTEPDALDLLEEAAHLLRRAPATAIAAYLAGTVPFLLGLMFFVAEMSRGAQADRRLAPLALGMVLLFAWMKAWQAVAAEGALAFLERRAAARLTAGTFLALLARQLRVQGLGLVVLPLAALVMLPFGWVYAYYQNATVLGLSAAGRLHRASAEQARAWPRQNHFILALVALMALVVFVNIAIAIYAVPSLLRSLLGVENLFATTGWNPLNTTFLAAASCVSFLVVDPFAKAVYVLRCFHGAARRTGVDLLLQVRDAMSRLAAGGVLVASLLFLVPKNGFAAEASAGPGPSPSPAAVSGARERAVEPATLDAAVERVLEQPAYAWRLPRVEAADDGSGRGVFARFLEAVVDWTRRAVKWMGDLIGKVLDFFSRRSADGGPAGGGERGMAGLVRFISTLLPVLVVVLVLALAWLGWRWWSQARRPSPPVAAPRVAPSLESEDVTADQLPEDEWMRLAREMLARGDVRLALRALFLASLAVLGARGALILARHKSNRDYERELARRGPGPGNEDLAGLFRENRRLLERAWYGRHSADPEDAARLERNLGRLREGVP